MQFSLQNEFPCLYAAQGNTSFGSMGQVDTHFFGADEWGKTSRNSFPDSNCLVNILTGFYFDHMRFIKAEIPRRWFLLVVLTS